ncbi:cytochrome b562 [Oceaniovalibus guishaninsula JLT2003]|uniref:Cytochrome b562 n=1 Tax=Oceaniovalibus guishaninsula JLT2003 TaxID=1231392 RepID=K2I9S6_9RHOB|nr:cytochrome b/b6 domain-containing protein [Oceaniovalibus guishaninsula]EKE45705.1 cytochrome b562 [Oceaniovalibus guishaninsula JLT2003]
MPHTVPGPAFIRAYRPSQIGMHWLIVGLVAMQFLTGQGMAAWFEAPQTRMETTAGTAWVHGIIGTSILIAMLYRLGLRRAFGAPPPPPNEPSIIQKVSRANHYLFYIFLIGMPIAGLTAILTGSEVVAEIHAWAALILLALIAAHILGALWHLVKRDGVVSRMTSRDY